MAGTGRRSPSWALWTCSALGEQAQAPQLASAVDQSQSHLEMRRSVARRTSSPPEVLTFGFKIQFLVPGRQNDRVLDATSHHADSRFQFTQVSQEGSQEEIARTLWHDLQIVMGNNNVVCEGAGSLDDLNSQAVGVVMPNILPKYNFWRIRPGNAAEPGCYRDRCEDCFWSANDSPFRFWDWKETEISSPVFKVSSMLNESRGWLGLTDLHALMVDSFSRTLTRDVCLNTSAYNGAYRDGHGYGLSVFVGLGGNPVPDSTLRRFITIMWLIEDALFKLCPPWRVYEQQSAPLASGTLLASIHPMSLPDVSPEALQDLIGPRLQQAIPSDILQRAWYIWHVPSKTLPRLMQKFGQTGCISIPGCDRHAVPNAIQIKHAGSTLRPGEMKSWMNVCLRLFQLCHFYDDQVVHRWRLKALLELVVDAIHNDKYSGNGEAGYTLLKQLNLAQDIPVWKEAERRWEEERLMSHFEWEPFVPPQVPRKVSSSTRVRDGHPMS